VLLANENTQSHSMEKNLRAKTKGIAKYMKTKGDSGKYEVSVLHDTFKYTKGRSNQVKSPSRRKRTEFSMHC
jgi:hypothetical protein